MTLEKKSWLTRSIVIKLPVINSCGVISLDTMTPLGQPLLRLYGWNTSKKGSLWRRNKVEEIQLTNLANLGSLASNKVEEIQPANLARLRSLGGLASKNQILPQIFTSDQ